MLVAVAKTVVAVITHSAALTAEAVHSFADTVNEALLLLGSKRAGRPASPSRPFGHARERYFWSFVVGLVLFGSGGVFALVEGVRKLVGAHHPTSLPLALVVLAVAAPLEGWSLRNARAQMLPAKHASGLGWVRYLRSTRRPETGIVFLEDLGAVAGLAIAAAGVLLTNLTGNSAFDATATIMIGLLLTLIAAAITTEMKSLLLGEPATERDLDRIRQIILSDPVVAAITELRTEHRGPSDLLIVARIALVDGVRPGELITSLERVSASIKNALTPECSVYIEPSRAQPAP